MVEEKKFEKGQTLYFVNLRRKQFPIVKSEFIQYCGSYPQSTWCYIQPENTKKQKIENLKVLFTTWEEAQIYRKDCINKKIETTQNYIILCQKEIESTNKLIDDLENDIKTYRKIKKSEQNSLNYTNKYIQYLKQLLDENK